MTGADAILLEVSTKLAQLQRESQSEDPKELHKKWWSLMRVLYVADAADADKIHWSFDLSDDESFEGEVFFRRFKVSTFPRKRLRR